MIINHCVQNIHNFYSLKMPKTATPMIEEGFTKSKLTANEIFLLRKGSKVQRYRNGGNIVKGCVFVSSDMKYLVFQADDWVSVNYEDMLGVEHILKFNKGIDKNSAFQQAEKKRGISNLIHFFTKNNRAYC